MHYSSWTERERDDDPAVFQADVGGGLMGTTVEKAMKRATPADQLWEMNTEH
jgi:hypothetical protein